MHSEIIDGVAVVTVVGELDLATVERAKVVVDETLAGAESLTGLVLDLSQAPWLDSVGLGLLVAVRTKAQDRGLTLVLRGLSPKVQRVLALSGLLDLFDVESTTGVGRFPLPQHTPLPPVADRKFDQIAELTRRAVDAPRAFVTLVDRYRQVFPGAAGVPADIGREEPLSRSLCQYVVTSAEPFVVPDTHAEPLVADNEAVLDGLAAYAGMPLRDLSGTVVGSLCVADDVPRNWTAAQLETLADLAAVASSELQLRAAVSDAAVSADRERLASDLNGRVFNELLSLSMLLSSAQSITSGRAGELLDEAALKVDSVLKSLRATIFDRSA